MRLRPSTGSQPAWAPSGFRAAEGWGVTFSRILEDLVLQMGTKETNRELTEISLSSRFMATQECWVVSQSGIFLSH